MINSLIMSYSLDPIVLLLLSSFIIITVLLLSLNFRSNWRWEVKIGVIIVSVLFYIFNYFAIIEIYGWPSTSKLPEKFKIHYTYIKEQDKFLNEPGFILMWLETLDEFNIPEGMPRVYKLPYSRALENELEIVKDKIEMGVEQAGTSEQIEQFSKKKDEKDNKKEGEKKEGAELTDESSDYDVESFEEGYQILFQDMPAVILPQKSPF
tara:strand:+ start:937 stop:1560 length:624 start_codon:yes stop_codon:yes gene_type:complete